MMGIAAGLAATRDGSVCSTFAMFAAGRAFEQVRNSIGYPHLNVKIGATHAGISVGEDRRNPSVQRGYCSDENDSRYGCDLSFR